MIQSKDNRIHNFKKIFPSLAKLMIGYREINNFELLVKLDDGSKIVYDDFNKSYRNLPRDSRNMTEQECRKEFGIRLRKTIERKGISQSELSAKTGISQPMISQYILGRKSPTFYRVDKIAKALGCSMDEFRYLDIVR